MLVREINHQVTKVRLLLVSLLLLGVFMTLCASPALAFRGHEFSFAFGGVGSGSGQFSEPSAMAVNEVTGQVYVLDQGNARVERFSSAGVYEAQFNGGETSANAFEFGAEALTGGIAVDNSCYFRDLSGSACSMADPSNGDVYVTDREHGVVDKFNSEGKYLASVQLPYSQAECGEPVKPSCPFKKLNGVGVDTNGAVWVYFEAEGIASGNVASFTNAEPNAFVSTRQLENALHTGFPSPGFAVDSKDNLYVRQTGISALFEVFEFDSSGKALGIPFVAEETSAAALDLVSGEVFLDSVSSVGAFSSSGLEGERFGVEHLTTGSGLVVSHEKGSTANTTVYVADSATGMVDVFPPEPPGTPIVKAGSESVSSVTADSATFGAEVDPHGASTEYSFEYGPCATPATCAISAYSQHAPDPSGIVGSDFEFHGVSAHSRDLLAGTVYHFRVVAHNEINGTVNTVTGEERTFTMQTAGAFVLPDARAWEMVSPPDKLGARILARGWEAAVQASAGGDALTYVASAPTEANPQGNANGVQVLSTRGAGGWTSRDLAIPHGRGTGTAPGIGSEYQFFSGDLSLGVVRPVGELDPSLSPEASEHTPFLRTDYFNGNLNEPCLPTAMHCYRPLVTGCPKEPEECTSIIEEHANVPPGTKFGGRVEFLGATPDFSHVVLKSGVALTATPTPSGGLYEWSAGQLILVSVLPNGGGPASNPHLGYIDGGARQAISSDGSRIVWESERHLYMRDTVRGETVPLDLVRSGEGQHEPEPEFQVASGEGSRVFFIDGQRLTEGSGGGNGTQEGDLYVCEIVEFQCELSDLTPLGLGGKSAHVRMVLGASEDGSWVYFVADGALVEGVAPGNCGGRGGAPPGATCNLYVRHYNGTEWERPTLIAVLSGEDVGDWARSNSGHLDVLTARVSPNGRWLAFMSQQLLTGYDNHDALSGRPDEEVYLYDAQAERLVCASCDPTGARPAGVELKGGSKETALVNAGREWETWVASSIPGWTPYELGRSRYQSRFLSDSGRLFFNSNDALVSQDVNGNWDVYQYEPPGVGSCSPSSVTFSERSGGCAGLISSGKSPEESVFMDASATGGEVFFLTAAKLSSKDFDTALDVYDAHECTVASPCLAPEPPPSEPCDTEASCRRAPSPQPGIFGAGPSETFSGIVNVGPLASSPAATPKSSTTARRLARALGSCRKTYKKSKKQQRRRRVVCERLARKRYGAKQSTRSGGRRK